MIVIVIGIGMLIMDKLVVYFGGKGKVDDRRESVRECEKDGNEYFRREKFHNFLKQCNSEVQQLSKGVE